MTHGPMKEQFVREDLNYLGFELVKEGLKWVVVDRRQAAGLKTIFPTRCRDLQSVIDLFDL